MHPIPVSDAARGSFPVWYKISFLHSPHNILPLHLSAFSRNACNVVLWSISFSFHNGSRYSLRLFRKKYIVRDRADSESLPLLFSRSFSELSDTFCKTGISFLFAFVPDHFLKCCITPYNCKTFLGSRNSSIQKISVI